MKQFTKKGAPGSICILLMLLLWVGCMPSDRDTARLPDDEKVILVNSLKVPCTGVGARQCLQVKEEKEGAEWHPLYSEIEGFKYEEGHTYRLVIREEQLPPEQVLADGSSIKYTLVNMLGKEQDPGLRLNDIWVLETIEGEAFTLGEMLERPRLEMHLTEKRIHGTDGCNNFNGRISRLEGSELEFGQIAGTRKMCPDMQIPNQMNRLMQEVRGYRLEEGKLYLLDGEGTDILSFQKTD
ncbi:MAG: DUF4377 domain-containing protein [Cyclobacteriaceae bacterium]